MSPHYCHVQQSRIRPHEGTPTRRYESPRNSGDNSESRQKPRDPLLPSITEKSVVGNPLPTDNGRGVMFGISPRRLSDSRYWTFGCRFLPPALGSLRSLGRYLSAADYLRPTSSCWTATGDLVASDATRCCLLNSLDFHNALWGYPHVA